MKMTFYLKMLFIFVLFPILLICINKTEGANNIIEIIYEYNEETNQVTAKMISTIEMKETKPTWKLSADKKCYTKIFYENMNYKTPVEFINGNKIEIEINIEQVKIAQLKMQYIYNEETNQVTAQIISDIELNNTKPTWELSADKKIFTKVYTKNEQYITRVVDKYNNEIDVEINIKQIDETLPQIDIEYKLNDDGTVTVYLKSDKLLKDTKPTWKLSEDKKIYEKIYTEREQNYKTLVQDVHGIEVTVNIDFKFIKFTYNQNDSSTIDVRYLYTEHRKVDVEIISSVKMKDTKPTWTLTENGYKYIKTYYDDQIYGTMIQDIKGLKKEVNLFIDISDEYFKGIDVSAHQGKIDWEEVKKSGIDYAIIRCGYGQDLMLQDDKKFEYNISECERLGIPYGIYIYSYALSKENVLSEADHVLRLVKGHSPEFGIWIDIEEDDYKVSNGMPSNQMFVEMAMAFCEQIKVNGYSNVGIYANTYWWEYKLNDSRLDAYKKWVAQWGGNCTYSKAYQMWQYTDSGKVDGIDGNVDMNIFKKGTGS